VRRRFSAPRGSLVALVALEALLAPRSFAAEALPPRAVRVAAAADLRFALDDVLAAFKHKRPDVTVVVTYGSSGNFHAQLLNRAPFDVFLSADTAYPRALREKGLSRGDVFAYAIGRLAVWVPKGSSLDIEGQGLRALLAPEARRIAIANPRHAPYGSAAEAALRTLGLFETLQPRLVYGENVAQAAQFAQTGAADAAIVALSLALAPALREGGRHAEAPRDAYPTMTQAGVILRWAHDRESARALRDFLLGPAGRATLEHYGFGLPGR
jgi:molybdate transport system substrate-binding protein